MTESNFYKRYLEVASEFLQEDVARLLTKADKKLKKAESGDDKAREDYASLLEDAAFLERCAQVCASDDLDVDDITKVEALRKSLANSAPSNSTASLIHKSFGGRVAFEKALSGIRVQTHAQKYLDPRLKVFLNTSHNDQGDLTAERVETDREIEIAYGNSAYARVAQIVRRLLELGVEPPAFEAGNMTTQYEKAPLYPSKSSERGYVAMRPIMPVWFFPELHSALCSVTAQKLLDSINGRIEKLREKHGDNDKKVFDEFDIPRPFSTMVRIRAVANPQNVSPYLNEIKGQIVQAVILPPSPQKDHSLHRWIARKWEQEDAINFDAIIKRASAMGVNDADLINRIAHQMHRHHGESIKGIIDAPENAGVRAAWFDAGKFTATNLTGLFESLDTSSLSDEFLTTLEEAINKQIENWKSLRDRAWNALQQIEGVNDERWRISDWRSQFNKGFESGMFARQDVNKKAASEKPSPKTADGKQEDRKKEIQSDRIRIYLNVDGMDAGTFAPSLGIPSLVGVWGALHNWIERKNLGKVWGFKVGGRNFSLVDKVSQQEYGTVSPLAVKSNDKRKVVNLIKNNTLSSSALHELFFFTPNNVIAQRSNVVGKLGHGQKEALGFEVKMRGEILIEVSLERSLNQEDMKALVNIIYRNRFLGGFIRKVSVTPAEGAQSLPTYGFFALKAVDDEMDDGNPLEDMFSRIVHVRGHKQDNPMPPFGFAQSGWRIIPDAPESTNCRGGEAYPWKFAEPVWSALRWVGWNNPDSAWWIASEEDDFVGVELD